MASIFGNIWEEDEEKKDGGTSAIEFKRTATSPKQAAESGSSVFGDIWAEKDAAAQKQKEQQERTALGTDRIKTATDPLSSYGLGFKKVVAEAKPEEKPSKMKSVLEGAGKLVFTVPIGAYKGYKEARDLYEKSADALSKTKFISEVAEAQVQLGDEGGLGMNILRTAALGVGDAKWVMNTDTGKKILEKNQQVTSNLPLKGVARIRAIGDETYAEAYKALLADREDPTNGAFKSFLYELQDSGTQSLIGVVLSVAATAATKNPRVGLAVGMPYYAALSGSEQLQSKGEVYSSTNIGIDTIGDSILNASLLKLFKVPAATLGRIAVDSGVEGATEVSQSLLKFANDYERAKTDEERKAILEDAKTYVTSGAILMEFFVGATVGAIAGGGVEVMNRMQGTPTTETGTGEVLNTAGSKTQAPKPPEPPDDGGTGGTADINQSIEVIRRSQAGETLTPAEQSALINAKEDFNDFAAVYGTRTVFIPQTETNPVSVSVDVVPISDDEFVMKYTADAGETAAITDYDLTKIYKTAEQATEAAQKAIDLWVQSQAQNQNITPETRTRLEDLAKKAQKPELAVPPAPKPTEAPATKKAPEAPIVSSGDTASLVAAYNASGRVAVVYKKKGTISLDGRNMPENEALKKMREILAKKEEAPAKKEENWREGYTKEKDVYKRQALLKAVANMKSTAQEQSDILDRVEDIYRKENVMAEGATIAWDVAQNPATDAETKARALALREEMLAPKEKKAKPVLPSTKKKAEPKAPTKASFERTVKPSNQVFEWEGNTIAVVMYHEKPWKVVPAGTKFADAQFRTYEPIASFRTRDELWAYLKANNFKTPAVAPTQTAEVEKPPIKLDGLTDVENAAVNRARKTGGVFMTAPTPPSETAATKAEEQGKPEKAAVIRSEAATLTIVPDTLEDEIEAEMLVLGGKVFEKVAKANVKKEKRTMFGKQKRPEQLVAKTNVKDLLGGKDRIVFTVINANPEIAVPNWYLYYKDDTTEMKLRPSALGLVDDNLKEFQEVILDASELKKKGTSFRLVDSEGNVWGEQTRTVQTIQGISVGDTVAITQKNGLGEPYTGVITELLESPDMARVDTDRMPLFGGGVFSFEKNNITKTTLTKEQRDNIEKVRQEREEIRRMTFGGDELEQPVFHGSGAKFDKPDLSYLGTGEGAQSFGWGFYVTEVEGIGRDYANKLGGGKDAKQIIDDTLIDGLQLTAAVVKEANSLFVGEYLARESDGEVIFTKDEAARTLKGYLATSRHEGNLLQLGQNNRQSPDWTYIDGALRSVRAELENDVQWMEGRKQILEKDYQSMGESAGAKQLERDYMKLIVKTNASNMSRSTREIQFERWLGENPNPTLQQLYDHISFTPSFTDMAGRTSYPASTKDSRKRDVRVTSDELQRKKMLIAGIDGVVTGLDEKNIETNFTRGGFLYELEVDDKAAETMLLWDAPFTEQPKEVQQALFDLTGGGFFVSRGTNYAWEETNEGSFGMTVREMGRLASGNQMTGEDIYNAIKQIIGANQLNPQIKLALGEGWSTMRSDEATSKWLLSKGVRGNKYKTGDTRNKNKWVVTYPTGSAAFFDTEAEAIGFVGEREGYTIEPPKADYNYVVFDTSDITVIARNGEKLYIEEVQDDGEMAEEISSQNRFAKKDSLSSRFPLKRTSQKSVPSDIADVVLEVRVGNRVYFRAIPAAQADEFSTLVDNGEDGIAGTPIQGRVYHISAIPTDYVLNERGEAVPETPDIRRLNPVLTYTGVADIEEVKLARKLRDQQAQPQPRDELGRFSSYNEIEEEYSDIYDGISRRVQKAEADTTKPSRFLQVTPEQTTEPDLALNTEALARGDAVEYDKLVRRSVIASRFSKALNATVRYGKMRQQAYGVFKPKQNVIRLSQKNIKSPERGGQTTTLFHEAGHFIDFTLHNFRKLIPASEMPALLEEYGSGFDGTPLPKRRAESFAEFLRYYITEPEKAKSKAPKFIPIFETTMAAYPEQWKAIQVAKHDWALWKEQPSTAKVAAQISFDAKDDRGFIERVRTKLNDFYRDAVNDLHPIAQFSAAAKKAAAKQDLAIKGEDDPNVLARNMRGWIGRATYFLEHGTVSRNFWKKGDNGRFYVDKTGKSLREILTPIDKRNALRDLSTYLVARRSIELAGRNITTGVSVTDAKNAIAELEARHSDFRKVAEELDKYQTALLDFMLESGVIDSEMYNKMKELNKNYVPFYRIADELERQQATVKGRGMEAKNPVKRIKGADMDIIDPIESIVKNTYALIHAAEQNNVMQSFAALAEKFPEIAPDFERVPVDQSKVASVNAKEIVYQALGADSELGKMLLPVDAQMAIESIVPDKLVDIFRPSFFQKGNVVTVMMNGKPRYYYVEENLYRAIKSMDREEAGTLVKLFSMPAQLLRAGATLTPEFMVRNPARDTVVAGIQSNYGFIPVFDTIRGLASLVKKDEYYQAWLISGGELASLVAQDRTEMQQTKDELLKKSARIKKYIKSPLEVLRLISSYSEQATRIGEARLALREGEDPSAAAFAAREISSDFLRIGAKTAAATKLTAFFNAKIQGLDKMARTFRDNPARTSLRVAMYVTIPSIVLYLLNRDEEDWDEIPQWQKDYFWLFKVGDTWYRIPKPFEYGLIYGSLPERFLEYLDGEDPEAVTALSRTILQGAVPNPTPTAMLPIIENITNYSFFLDRPIVSQGLQNLPNEDQYTRGTSKAAVIAGDWVNYSPAKIENIIKGYFAGLGQYALDATDAILKGTGIENTIAEPEKKLSQEPVIRAFVVADPRGSGSNSVNDFYEARDDATKAHNKIQDLFEAGRTEEARIYMAEHPEFKFYSTYNGVADTISEIRKMRNITYDSPSMSPAEKRKKLDELDALMTTVAHRAITIELK